MTEKIHHGQNIRKLRDMLGIKQENIALEINMSQQNFSKLEQKKIIDDETLEKIADAMNISPDTIKRFNDDGIINIISSNFHDNSGPVMYNFNPIEKVVELYEKLMEEKDKRILSLEKLLQEK
jgi:transcriptional regulator with XRE-family HTH domain